MAEVTRVPLQPIAKGSLTKLWLGVIVAVLIGAGIAWAAVPAGIKVSTITAGTGDSIQVGDVAFVKYTGKLASNGEVFDESQEFDLPIEGFLPEGNPFPVQEGATIPGFFTGLQKMQVGGKYELYIPAELAYGAEERRDPQTGDLTIPANSDLIFEMEVMDTMSEQEFQQRVGMLQQLMMGGGPPEGAPAAPPAE